MSDLVGPPQTMNFSNPLWQRPGLPGLTLESIPGNAYLIRATITRPLYSDSTYALVPIPPEQPVFVRVFAAPAPGGQNPFAGKTSLAEIEAASTYELPTPVDFSADESVQQAVVNIPVLYPITAVAAVAYTPEEIEPGE